MKILSGENILIGPSSFCAIDKHPLEMLINAGAKVVDNPYKRKLTKPELLKLLSDDITGLIAGLETLDKEVLSASKLKVISRCGSGMSNVDIKAAKDMGIIVCSTPDAPVASVAELTLCVMLSLLRKVTFMNEELHAKRWSKEIGNLLENKTIVIVGFGRIGKRLHGLLVPFKARIIIVDPLLKQKSVKGALFMKLKDALRQADIITLHSSSKECLIGNKEFSLIKEGAYLLNSARGMLIDEVALIKALDNKHIAGAWIDTFEEEPYSGQLTKYRQVLLTPHVGSYTAECRKRMETEAVENLINAFGVLKK